MPNQIGKVQYECGYIMAGGIWYYTDHIRPNQGAAGYKELVANDGKELMAFSDFPMPEEYDMVCLAHNFQLIPSNFCLTISLSSELC